VGPPAERGREASRGQRRYARLETSAPARSGGGVRVATLLRSCDVQVQAALTALASLAVEFTSLGLPLDPQV
jgi:hypothetical protein